MPFRGPADRCQPQLGLEILPPDLSPLCFATKTPGSLSQGLEFDELVARWRRAGLGWGLRPGVRVCTPFVAEICSEGNETLEMPGKKPLRWSHLRTQSL